jgi:hypothetical protein
MKIILWMLMSLLFTVSLALGQASSEKPGHRTNTQIITYILDFQEKRVLGIAEIMPADKYSFAPSIGAFKGVRTFGEELKHIAADNYLLGAGILGEKPSVDVGTGESGSSTYICGVRLPQSTMATLQFQRLTFLHGQPARQREWASLLKTVSIPGTTMVSWWSIYE